MAVPAKERVKKRRKRVARAGGKTLSVLIDKQTAEMMDALLQESKKTKTAMVARAIKTLYSYTFEFEDDAPSTLPHIQKPLVKELIQLNAPAEQADMSDSDDDFIFETETDIAESDEMTVLNSRDDNGTSDFIPQKERPLDQLKEEIDFLLDSKKRIISDLSIGLISDRESRERLEQISSRKKDILRELDALRNVLDDGSAQRNALRSDEILKRSIETWQPS